MLVTLRRGDARRRSTPASLAAIAGGMLIAPFFLFSALAGELADRFERARLLQILKARRVGRPCSAPRPRCSPAVWRCRSSRCSRSATQATFSSPVRYALLPQHLATDELVDGNALLEGGTFLAILFGTIAGGIAVALDLRHRGGLSAAGPVRGGRVRREPVRAARPGPVARLAPQPQPGRRDRRRSCAKPGSAATSSCRSSARRGSGWSARCSCRRSRPLPRRRWAPAAAS